MSVDLHLHTHYSDGNWSPEELIDHAIKLGFKSIAITDHDTVAALPEAQTYAAGKLRLINGIELNTIWRNPQGKFQDVHILGYFINPESAALKEAMDKQQAARSKHLAETLERLDGQGFKISIQQVQSEAGKGTIGRPHICAAMLKHGVVNDVQDAYKLLMNHDSKLRVVRRSIAPQDAIAAIASAGGLSSLAHPGKDPHMKELIEELVKGGLNALEAHHKSHTLPMVRKYLKLAAKHRLLVTGGSDCHGPFGDFPASIGTVRLASDLLKNLDEAHARKFAKSGTC